MSVSFQQLKHKIRKITSGAKEEQEELSSRRIRARALWEKHANDHEVLIRKVTQARKKDAILRCALPTMEPLDNFSLVPPLDTRLTLIAADGSQINPDRHSAIFYSLINIGLIAIKPGTGETPQTYTFSELKYGEELYMDSFMINEEMVSLQRDLAERKKLLEISMDFDGPILALTDGPLEVWGLKQGFSENYQRTLENHLKVLEEMQAKGSILAGFVEKPGANLVVRLLEIADANQDDLKDLGKFTPLRGVNDRWLFRSLPPGARSAVFGIQSNSKTHYQGLLALHFFYLNTSMDEHSNIVRVEIPAWVASDRKQLDILHASLIEQCRIMGFSPYPYILHRAHEIALVTYEEKRYVEQLLANEFLNAGMEVEGNSFKKFAKELPGRARRN
ncbi:DNA double-strand break repair nuclease NurA [Chloroflexota bacterium]